MQEHLAICFEVEPGLFQLVDQASGEEIAKTHGNSSLKGTAEINGWLEVHDRDEREYRHRFGEGYRSTYIRAERIPGHVDLPEEPVVILDLHPEGDTATPVDAEGNQIPVAIDPVTGDVTEVEPPKKETAAEKKKREKAEKAAAEKAAAEAAAKEETPSES